MSFAFEIESIIWHPDCDMLFIFNEQYFSLVTDTGQIIWTSKHQKQGKLLKFKLSSDNSHFCLIYDSGEYCIYNSESGRQVFGFQSLFNDVLAMDFGEFCNEYGAVITSPDCLHLNLGNNVRIDDLNLNCEPRNIAFYENRYLIDCNDTFQIVELHSEEVKQKLFSGSLNHDHSKITLQTPDPIESLSVVCTIKERFEKHVVDFESEMSEFLQLYNKFLRIGEYPELQTDLSYAAMSSKCSDKLKEWMQSEHEQGFKKWYTSSTQHLNKALNIMNEIVCLDIRELFDVKLSSLANINELQRDCYHFLSAWYKSKVDFELQACFLQKLFSDETDRAILITEVKTVNMQEVLVSVSTELLGGFNDQFLTNFKTNTAALFESLDSWMNREKSRLRGRIGVKYVLLDEWIGSRVSRHLILNYERSVVDYVVGKSNEVWTYENRVLICHTPESVNEFKLDRDFSHVCLKSNDMDFVLCLVDKDKKKFEVRRLRIDKGAKID